MGDRAGDGELVARTARGDREAYRLLVEKYQDRLFRIAYDIVRSKEDAEDIVQESFVKAYLSLPEFRGHSSFYTWLYRIAYNMAIDYKRKMLRRGGTALEYDETQTVVDAGVGGTVSQPIENPLEFLQRKEKAKLIAQSLEEISEEHRAVIMLREVDGLSYEEISDIIGVARGTVMSRLHYARKKLQKALGGFAPEGVSGDWK